MLQKKRNHFFLLQEKFYFFSCMREKLIFSLAAKIKKFSPKTKKQKTARAKKRFSLSLAFARFAPLEKMDTPGDP